jgi:hypothetical protein
MCKYENVRMCELSQRVRKSERRRTDCKLDRELIGPYSMVYGPIAARSAQLDAIMGPDKLKQYPDYVKGKIE